MRAWVIASNGYNFWDTPIASFFNFKENLKITHDALHINPNSRLLKRTVYFSDIDTVGTYHGFILIKLNIDWIRLTGVNYDRLLIVTWDNRKFIHSLPFEREFRGKIPIWPARLMFLTNIVWIPLFVVVLAIYIKQN